MLEAEYPKRFYLIREEDLSGISGTGIVAFGVKFFNGKCTLCWRGAHSSLGEYDSADDLLFIHGHENRTKIVWLD